MNSTEQQTIVDTSEADNGRKESTLTPFERRESSLIKRFVCLYEVSDSASRVLAMEGIRGIAILLVFFVHLHGIFSPHILSEHSLIFACFEFFAVIGHAGVDLFFVLSGYLIYGALIRREVQYFKFIYRRVERIYPAFLCVFGIYLILSVIFPSENKIHGPFISKAVYILENLLLLPGTFQIKPIITVAWSLSYEFFFYLSVPILVRIMQLLRWSRAARVAFFVVFGVAYISYSFLVSGARDRFVMFISGILLYEAIDSGAYKWMMSKRGEVGALLLFLGSLVWAYLIGVRSHMLAFLPGLNVDGALIPGVAIYQGPYRVLFLSISCFVFLIYCLKFEGVFQRVFSWAPLRYLGNMSYSYYLIHGLTLKGIAFGVFWVMPASGHAPILFCVLAGISFIATLGTATLLFGLVEKPLSIKVRSRSR